MDNGVPFCWELCASSFLKTPGRKAALGYLYQTFRDHLLVGVLLGTGGLCRKLSYLTPCSKGPFKMEDIYYLKGNESKCFHEQSQDRAINLPKR